MRLVLVVAAVLVAAPAWAQDPMGSTWPSTRNSEYLNPESWVHQDFGPVRVMGPKPRPQPPQPQTTIITIDREVPVYTPPAQTYVQPYYAPYYAQRPYRPHPQPTPQGEVYLPRRR